MMNEKMIVTRMTRIFTADETRRVSVDCSGQSVNLQADVHGMSRMECMIFLRNLINLFRGPFSVNVVHGYNNGTVLRDLLRTEKISPKVTSVCWDTHNDGITRINVRPLCA